MPVARALAPRLEFDLVLLDIYLRDGDGLDLGVELRSLNDDARIVVLTSSEKPADLFRALRSGVDGYLTKDMAASRLGETLAAAAQGEAPLSRRMTSLLVHEYQRVAARRAEHRRARGAHLTHREWQILGMLAGGLRTGEIAAELVVSIETVRSHVKAILRKLEVHTRAAAVAYFEEMRETTDVSLT